MARRPNRVTLRDVATLADVSAATVSYVLNERGPNAARITQGTRDRVLAAVRDLAYVPHQSGRNLRRSETRRICLSIPRLGVPVYDALASELQDESERQGYQMIVTLRRAANGADEVFEQMQGGLADALVLVLEQEQEARLGARLAGLAKRGVPTVVFGNGVAPDGFDVVSDDDHAACRKAVTYLIERGHTRIGCLALRLGDGTRHYRFDAYVRALRDAGMAFDECLVRDGAGSRTDSQGAALDLLRSASPPTALFACTDIAALSAMRAARGEGLHVPDDVAVVGTGDIVEGEFVDPPLTTVGPERRSFDGVAELLFTRIRARDPSPGRRIVKRWELKKRGSA